MKSATVVSRDALRPSLHAGTPARRAEARRPELEGERDRNGAEAAAPTIFTELLRWRLEALESRVALIETVIGFGAMLLPRSECAHVSRVESGVPTRLDGSAAAVHVERRSQ